MAMEEWRRGQVRISLEALSHKSARRRPSCDGRSLSEAEQTEVSVSWLGVRAALFRDSTALSEWRRGDKKIPKNCFAPNMPAG